MCDVMFMCHWECLQRVSHRKKVPVKLQGVLKEQEVKRKCFSSRLEQALTSEHVMKRRMVGGLADLLVGWLFN